MSQDTETMNVTGPIRLHTNSSYGADVYWSGGTGELLAHAEGSVPLLLVLAPDYSMTLGCVRRLGVDQWEASAHDKTEDVCRQPRGTYPTIEAAIFAVLRSS